MPRLGILGTFVHDTIWTPDDVAAGRPFVSWGGLAYALSAAAAARPQGWEVVPIVRIGHDLAAEARAYMAGLPGVFPGSGVREVPEPNNRVELRYADAGRRGERLTGGVSPWHWRTLAPALEGVDALCVNFFSGFEMDLETAERLREGFAGPIYADLHSLFLGPAGDGPRERRRLPEWARWAACFDAVQLNEDELAMIGDAGATPAARMERLLAAGPGLVLVTLGAEGAAAARRHGFPDEPREWPAHRQRTRTASGAEHLRIPVRPAPGDPTGCGDVWGTTLFCALLNGLPLRAAAERAHAAARRKLGFRGAEGLHAHLAAAAGQPGGG